MFDQDQLKELTIRDKQKKFNFELPFYFVNSQGVCKRDILIQWVIQQSSSFKHSIKTLELAVIYIDIYLNSFNIPSQYLQLLGISAYSLASKFNETEAIGQIKLQDNFGQNLYHDQEYYEMEIQLMKSLEFQLNHITQSDYLVAMGVSMDESITSTIMFILMDFEIYQKSQLVLAFAIFNFQQDKPNIFTNKIESVTQLLRNKISQVSDQFNLDNMENNKSQSIKKKICKRREYKISNMK